MRLRFLSHIPITKEGAIALTLFDTAFFLAGIITYTFLIVTLASML